MSVDPEILYRDYPYVSGTSQTLRQYFAYLCNKIENDFGLYENGNLFTKTDKGLRVLDIASNDGSFLWWFAQNGHQVVGVDPAENLLPLSQGLGVSTICGFWNEETAAKACMMVDGGKFDVIVAMNVLGHCRNPLEFLQLCKQCMAPGGKIYIQTSQAEMVKDGQFDTVYHEHLSFFSPSSFSVLAHRAGLYVEDITIADIHGGSYLVRMADANGNALRKIIYNNHAAVGGMAPNPQDTFYDQFQDNAELISEMTRLIIGQCRDRTIIGFGAAAKAMTFINFGRIPMDYIVDENPMKISKRCPGSNIEVKHPSAIVDEGKCLFILTAWNFADEIKAKIKGMRPGKDDLFLTYFPELRVWK